MDVYKYTQLLPSAPLSSVVCLFFLTWVAGETQTHDLLQQNDALMLLESQLLLMCHDQAAASLISVTFYSVVTLRFLFFFFLNSLVMSSNLIYDSY